MDTRGLLWDGSFESTDKWVSRNGAFGKYSYSCIVAADRVAVVDDPRGINGKVARFTTKDGDLCNAAGPTERAEVLTGISNYAREGSDLYYGSSTMLSADWTDNIRTEWGLIVQWHGAKNLVPFGVSLHAAASSPPQSVHFGGSEVGTVQVLSDMQKNKWYYFITRIKWTSTTNGVAELWYRTEDQKEYAKLKSYDNIRTIPAEGLGGLQYGYYRGHNTNTKTLFHGSLKIGTTFDSVR